MTRYENRAEAIAREITDAGITDAEHDVEAIADEVLTPWTADQDEHGRTLQDTGGFELNADVDFWAAVARHER